MARFERARERGLSSPPLPLGLHAQMVREVGVEPTESLQSECSAFTCLTTPANW